VSKADTPVARTRFEAAYQQLRQMLLDRKYLPKERLIEADLVAALGVSRSTVRGVLIRLQQDGLIEIEPNRGARVSTLTFEEAVQHFEVREVLEGLLARIAATRMSDDALADLSRIYGQMETALDADGVFEYASLNRRFHQLIVDSAGSHRAATLLRGLSPTVVREQFHTVLLPGRKDLSLGEHLAILRALERRDADGAEAAARAHARGVRAAFIAASARMAAV